MSFWDTHKDTFKAAGKSAAVGIGRGSVALTKAGVRTYKNHNGGTTSSSTGEVQPDPQRYGAAPPPLAKDQLSSLPPPPGRAVPPKAYQYGATSYSSPQLQAQTQPQTQPPQVQPQIQPQVQQPQFQQPQPYPAQQVAAPPAYSAQQQDSYAAQVQPQPHPLQSGVPQTGRPQPPPPPRQPQPLPQAAPQTAPQAVHPAAVQPAVVPATPAVAQQTTQPTEQQEEAPVKPKAPLPDPTSFAPPPIHKARGSSLSPQGTSSSIGSAGKAPAALTSPKSSQPSLQKAPSKPVPVIAPGIDTSKFAPPPRPYHGTPAAVSPTPSGTSASSRPVPAPPPRVPSRTPTGSAPVVAPVASSTPVAAAAQPQKVPPPKPVKKPGVKMPNEPPPYREMKTDSASTTTENPVLSNPVADISDFSLNAPSKPPVKPKPSLLSRVSTTSSIDTASPEKNSFRNEIEEALAKRANSGVIPAQKSPSPSPSPAVVEPEVKSKPKPPVKPKPVIKPKPETVKVSPSPVPSPVAPVSKPAVKPVPPPARTASPASPAPVKATSPTPPPPPVRNYTRSKMAPPPVATGPPQLNLELETGWFTKMENALPKDFQGLNYTSSYKSSTSSAGFNQPPTTNHTRILNCKLQDLSVLRYEITWTNSDIASAKASITEYIPSPFNNPPSKTDLIAFSNQFGGHVAAWCEHNMGKQVGRGECWDLAKEALQKGCGKHAMVSTYKHHGFPILAVQGTDAGLVYIDGKPQLDEIRRGDIIQYETCTFYNEASRRTSTAGAPDHTSVVLSKDSESIKIAEQNVNGVRQVMTGEVIIKDLKRGSLVVYRPVPVEWAPQL